MKWKALAFWLLVFAGLFFFFRSFNIFFYQQQEEMQLFIPEWFFIRDLLFIPGGFCSVSGQMLVQYYPDLFIAISVNSLLISSTGVFCYLLLQTIARREYNLLLALVPVAALMKVHMNLNYVPDGTIGILLMLLLLFLFTVLRRKQVWFLYSLASTFVIYVLAGQMAALYGIALAALSFFQRKEKWPYSFFALFTGLGLSFLSTRLSLSIPLTDGIYSIRYQEKQMLPESFIYFVWIRYTLLLVILYLITYSLDKIMEGKRLGRIVVTGSTAILVSLFICFFCLPDRQDIQNRLIYELSYWERHQKWDNLIQMHKGKKIPNPISQNYLNMALAAKGELGDKLFHFDQQGPQSLIAPWDGSYYMSAMLSDIHYMIGDISTAESYAMEGLTLAKRTCSPRMLQRLIQTNLIRGEYAIARKYINLLERTPYYHTWAEKYKIYLCNPEKIAQDKELGTKKLPSIADDNLLCLVGMDSLWERHLSEPAVNRIALDYLGCSYLLAKEMNAFKALLLRIADKAEWQPLPIHFQEAALVLSVEDASVLEKIKVRPEIIRRCRQFQADIKQARNNPDGLGLLYRQYGDTFWFYYYCKQLN